MAIFSTSSHPNHAFAQENSKIALTLSDITSLPHLSDSEFSVSGTITNNLSNDIANISLVLDRGTRIEKIEDAIKILKIDHFNSKITIHNYTVKNRLNQGEKTDFSFQLNPSADSTSSSTQEEFSSLTLSEPGIYPCQLTVSASDSSGFHQTFVRFLLDILPPSSSNTSDSAVASKQISMILPLTSTPSLAPGFTGGQKIVSLTDNHIIQSVTNGRLHNLLTNIERIVSDPYLLSGVCLAIDPDLLITLNSITKGYRIQDHTYPGVKAASLWLDHLRTIAAKTCVISSPLGNANLDLLTKINNPSLLNSAFIGPDIIDAILHIHTDRSTFFVNQALTEDTLSYIVHNRKISTLVLCTGSENIQGTSTRILRSEFISAPQLSSNALDSSTASSLTAEAELHLRLNSALSYASLLIPPNEWNISGKFSHYVADLLLELAQKKALSAVPINSLPTNPPISSISTDTSNNHLAQSHTAPISNTYTQKLQQMAKTIDDLSETLIDSGNSLTPMAYLAPLREDLLRSISLSYIHPGKISLSKFIAELHWRTNAVHETLLSLQNQIKILPPSTVYALASKNSPLIIALSNKLPYPVLIHLIIQSPVGLKVDTGRSIQIPALSRQQVQLSSYSSFSRLTSVIVQLQSPSGTLIGNPVRMSVRANAYGKYFFDGFFVIVIMLCLLILHKIIIKSIGTDNLLSDTSTHKD